MIVELDGIFIESSESLIESVVGCRIYTQYQPCIALFTCNLEQLFKLSALESALKDENGNAHANRFMVEDVIRFLDESLGIIVLQKEDE